jgi:hypothetical protein
MRLEKFTSNCHLLHLDSGAAILFSYQTAVAFKDWVGKVYTPGHTYSVTTSTHIGKFVKKGCIRKILLSLDDFNIRIERIGRGEDPTRIFT